MVLPLAVADIFYKIVIRVVTKLEIVGAGFACPIKNNNQKGRADLAPTRL